MEKTKVAIVGLGTVGSGVARLLLDFGDRTARHAGRTLWLEKAVVRDLERARDCDLPAGVLTDNIDDVVDNPDIKVVAQLIGGLEPARSIMLKLLESGKDVVTANKALLAQHGREILERARQMGVLVLYEAAVAGGRGEGPVWVNYCIHGIDIFKIVKWLFSFKHFEKISFFLPRKKFTFASTPSRVMSSFKPVAVLNGKLKSTAGSVNLRKALVVFQFAM